MKSISRLQWHPFTVTSNSNTDPDQLSVVIRSEGIWSQNLYEKLSSPTPIDCLEISVEGPYSPASTSFLRSKTTKETKQRFIWTYILSLFSLFWLNWERNPYAILCRHEVLVLVSGGSGITPFISIIRELIFIANTNKKTPRILLVAAFKKSADLAMLDLLLPFSGTSHDISRVELQIEAYVTRDGNPSPDSEKLPQSVWFKPSVLDRPISMVLGSSSWLWLGAIISSSFTIFLLLIGLINRYYIYPIDHNTDMIYSYTKRSIISALILCLSVVIVATVAFVWNKEQNSKDKRQIQSTETPTPTASPVPESWFYEVERELENIPNQSIKQVTTVHYGRRPNMKSKFLYIRKTFEISTTLSLDCLNFTMQKYCPSVSAKNQTPAF